MNAIVTVVGQDKVGIIAAICALLAENNVNILDMTPVNGKVFGRIITKNMAGWIQLDHTTYTASGGALADYSGILGAVVVIAVVVVLMLFVRLITSGRD